MLQIVQKQEKPDDLEKESSIAGSSFSDSSVSPSTRQSSNFELLLSTWAEI